MTKARFAFRRLTAASVLLLGAAVGACADDSSNNDDGGLAASTTYVGLVASSAGSTGPLNITFASAVAAPPAWSAGSTGPSLSSAAPITATGTVSIGGGAAVPLTGTIDNGVLNMSGGGWTLTGNLADGQLTGTFTGPSAIAGSFTALSSTDGVPAAAYCGYYEGLDHTDDPPSDDFGTFSAVIAGDIVLGTAVTEGGDVIDFTGSATATSFTIDAVVEAGALHASGDYDELGVDGDYNIKVGTFTASDGIFYGYVCGAT